MKRPLTSTLDALFLMLNLCRGSDYIHLPSNSLAAKKMESSVSQYNQLKQLYSILPEGGHLKEIECYGSEDDNRQHRILISRETALSDCVIKYCKEYGCSSNIFTEVLVHLCAVSEGREILVKSV